MESIREYGTLQIDDEESGKKFFIISIIGEIEGHNSASEKIKTTKYEHLLPMLVAIEGDEEIDGVLFLVNTVGGDVSCGLALAEMIASITKPTVSLVIGDSHSIGVPLSVAADHTIIAPSATVVIHPVRMSGTVLGAPQTYEYFQLIQERITNFIAKHSDAEKKDIEKMMVTPGILSRDLGTILVGKEAVKRGLYDEVGGISEAIKKLREM